MKHYSNKDGVWSDCLLGNKRSSVASFLCYSCHQSFTSAFRWNRQCWNIYWWKLRHLSWYNRPTH